MVMTVEAVPFLVPFWDVFRTRLDLSPDPYVLRAGQPLHVVSF